MIYNNWGELFYVTGTPNFWASNFVTVVYPWWMTLLFTLAGISSFYALDKRSAKEYERERIHKLLIPFLSGLVLIVPVQSYIADVFHNGYTGGYLKHLIVFFTRITDLYGSDGGFTPGHLWFILYLYLISMVMVPVMSRYKKAERKINTEKITMAVLLPMFLIILISKPILEIGGKSIGESLACFAIGFFLLSSEQVQKRLEKNRLLLTVLFLAAIAGRLILASVGQTEGIIWDFEQVMVTWFGILAILGMGKRYLNRSNGVTAYFSKAAFPLYYFHQSLLVILAYFCVRYIQPMWGQFLVIMTGTFVLSILCYEICRRWTVTSFLFGIKHQK